MMKYKASGYLLFLSTTTALPVLADGLVVDKVYHPYVDALESELEYRLLLPGKQQLFETPIQLHQLSLGTAIGSRVFVEAYLAGEKARGGGFDLEAFELETKWQLTEQGEYAADLGLLFEYETKRHTDAQEFTVAMLVEKEWGQWSGTANFRLIDEWGGPTGSEFETAFAAQIRRRWSSLLEPGLEFYAGEDTRGAGPVLQGNIVAGVRRSLHWEGGVIFGLNEEGPPATWRFLLEY
jgi:hypothetical protein